MAFPSLREDASSLEKTSSLLSKPPGTEQSHEGQNTPFFFFFQSSEKTLTHSGDLSVPLQHFSLSIHLITKKLFLESFIIKNGPKYNLLLSHTGNELILLNFKAISNFMGVK